MASSTAAGPLRTRFVDISPDLLMLDVRLPAVDRLDVCRILRREFNVPVLMLTALARLVCCGGTPSRSSL